MNWYNISTTPIAENPGKRVVMPPEVLREIAAASDEGGRKFCGYCHRSYSANYMLIVLNNRLPFPKNQEETDICKYCYDTMTLVDDPVTGEQKRNTRMTVVRSSRPIRSGKRPSCK